MKPKKIWANLTVSDVKRTAEFYTRLGFKPNGKNESAELVSFLFGEDDFVIHFFAEGSQLDMQGIITSPENGNEIMFTLSADTKQEVDDWAKEAAAAGATIFQNAGEDDKGYYVCGFADPDGHKFNVLWVHEGM